MRFWTTLIMLALVAAGVVLWQYWGTVGPTIGFKRPTIEQSASARELTRITPESLMRIELDNVRLERQGNNWNLPGEWPTRSAEVTDLVGVLTNLQSRFAPEPFNHPQTFGLAADQKPVTIRATVHSQEHGEKTFTLVFGEPSADKGNPFVRATYLHVDDQPEVLRLAPGLMD